MTRPERKDIALAIGLVGVLTALALVVLGDVHDADYSWPGRIGVVIIAGPSAWLAGLAFGGMFGRPRVEGWILALLGACLSTALGAVIGGTVVFPVIGTFIAPLVLFDQALANPMFAFVWISLMMSLHFVILKSDG